jgi:predicted TIM-barrel fold metal-dependent hydrolase
MAIELFGADRVLYATDHPFWRPAWTEAAVADLDLGPEVLRAIEHDNARRVFRLDRGAGSAH